MRVAAIDIGTNTVLLLVAEQRATLEAVREVATITRLGEGVDKTRTLSPDAIQRTNACLDAYAAIVRDEGVSEVAVVGTSAMRDAGGGDAVRAHVRAKFGVEARTISGEEEARLTFAGALSGMPIPDDAGDVMVFDIGGGSTEVVRGDPRTRAIGFSESFDVGSVRMTERFVRNDPPTDAEQGAIATHARAIFGAVPRPAPTPWVVGIAGTVTTLAAVSLGMTSYDSARVHGLTLPVTDVAGVVRRLAKMPLSERQRVPGLEPKRADVIVAGGQIALSFLETVGATKLTVSDRGVRWGLAAELARSKA